MSPFYWLIDRLYVFGQKVVRNKLVVKLYLDQFTRCAIRQPRFQSFLDTRFPSPVV